MAWLHTHRLLLVVYAAGLALAMFEMALPEGRGGEIEDPQSFLEPGINIADVSSAIYPNRAITLYYLAYQASLCTGSPASRPPECRLREPVRPGEIRDLIERSLATGNRSNELAWYNYAVVLIQERASSEKIDDAVRNWRLAFPGSPRPDPREAHRSKPGRRQEPARPD